MDLTDAERRVLDALDTDALVTTLVELVRIPSVGGTDAEGDIQAEVARRLTTLGLEVDHWRIDLPSLAAEPGFPGAEVTRAEAYGVAATSGGGHPALILQGHVDVVPVGDPAAWAGDPFSAHVADGVLHGRGACDMKGGVAAMLAAAAALQASGLRFERAYAVQSVVGEEDGGLGAYATLRRGHAGEVAVIPEPTAGRLISAAAGSVTFRLEVPGRAAHGSSRLEGVSALEGFARIHAALGALEDRRNTDPDARFAGHPLPYATSVGRVRAGDWASSVPDLLVAEGRHGVRLGEDPAEARRALEEAVAEACAGDPFLRDHPARVTWPGGVFASGQVPPGHPLVAEVQSSIAAVTGAAVPEVAAPYGSDLRQYAAAGIPTLHYGPGDIAVAHGPRERVSLAEVVRCAQVLAVWAVRRLEGHL